MKVFIKDGPHAGQTLNLHNDVWFDLINRYKPLELEAAEKRPDGRWGRVVCSYLHSGEFKDGALNGVMSEQIPALTLVREQRV